MTALVAMFNTYAEAQAARAKLAEQGITENMTQLASADKGSAVAEHDHRGFFATLMDMFGGHDDAGHFAEGVRRGSAVLTVELADEAKADGVRKILEDCGAVDVNRRVEGWKASGYKGYDKSAPGYTNDEIAKERDTFKVIQEDVKVGKRQVEGDRVRVLTRVVERPVTEKVTLHQEKVIVERRPVDRAATTAEMAEFGKKEKDIELRETSEEVLISKTARVVEEISVGKKSSDHTQTVRDTVRRTEVDVQKADKHARE